MDGIKWEERTLADVAARLEELDGVISQAEKYASRLEEYHAFRNRLQGIVRDRVTDFPPVEDELSQSPEEESREEKGKRLIKYREDVMGLERGLYSENADSPTHEVFQSADLTDAMAQAFTNGSTEQPDPADQIHPNNPANRVD